MGWYLLVKEAEDIGIKYLCKSIDTQDPYEYPGSGALWKRYLKKHKPKLKTTVLGHFSTKEEFRSAGSYYSKLWDIVESKEWANLIPETGDGGDTISGKFLIHNPETGERKFVASNTTIPAGWVKGGTKFKKSAESIEKSRRAHVGKKRSIETRAKMAEAWKTKRSDKDERRSYRACVHCGRLLDLQNIGRHENKFCKEISK